MSKDIVMAVRGLAYSYGAGPEIIHGMDFDLREGEFAAVMGANGSGKTTLIKLLAGLLEPGKGDVLLSGQNMKSVPNDRRYTRIGVVFQNPDDQLFAMTVADDVAFGPRNMGLDEHTVMARVKQALELVHAAHLMDRGVAELSYGQKKRVAIAGVLAMGSSILLLDEPAAGLDPAGENSIMRLIGELNRNKNVTVVMAAHSVDMIPLFASRVMILDKGKIMTDGPMRVALTDGNLLDRAGLRLPYVASLMRELEIKDGLSFADLPLTIGEARRRILELLPESALDRPEGALP
ncbi:MAG: ATP-binding cassette domain-containing protein [Nitrospinae bacterium]|nr:ATP-binding cassette domain-containing protein [Nitrospinota bacterium]